MRIGSRKMTNTPPDTTTDAYTEFANAMVPDVLPCPEVHPWFMRRGERWDGARREWVEYAAEIQCRLPLGHGTEHEGSEFKWSTRTRC